MLEGRNYRYSLRAPEGGPGVGCLRLLDDDPTSIPEARKAACCGCVRVRDLAGESSSSRVAAFNSSTDHWLESGAMLLLALERCLQQPWRRHVVKRGIAQPWSSARPTRWLS